MLNNSTWLATACSGLLGLVVLTAAQLVIPQAIWWTFAVSIILMLVIWKFAARSYLGRVWNTNMTADEIKTAKPFAFVWLALYFLGATGFVVLVVLSGYYQYPIPSGILITLIAAWFIKTEIWALCLVRATTTTH
ncbi:hypothetical protein VN12_16225 [Pirellula sp. SH-Sr6A]|uniref:hypothetical protein n=1 Tax=Pirellula sp. SH-Sr6A TaxID=1632865 RepID=UPI00078BC9D5|nr:hypothetical protein [Pirellula sp. SH-Sr6A]AMV33676.1 hypothetical protein VN12_16225 [Pirellula sp. SH-Sr6A]